MPSPYWQLNDADWLRTEYIQRGRTGRGLAAEIGVHPNTLARALERLGIRKTQPRTMATVPKRWLREQHVSRGRSTRDIAAELRVAPASVQRALVAAGIPVNDCRLPAELDDVDWLAAHDHLERGDIARILGCSKEAVSRARQRHGLRDRGRSPFPRLNDPEWLRARYHDDGWSQQRIADHIGCSRAAVTQAMQRYGIPARPRAQARFWQLAHRAWLAERVHDGRSPAQIAAEVGCERTTVVSALKRHGLR